MSRLVAINLTDNEGDIIDHFDGTPEEFGKKYNAFFFDKFPFFKVGKGFDCDGDFKFYWYCSADARRKNSYDDYIYVGCQTILVLLFDDGTCITKRTPDADTNFDVYGEFEDNEDEEEGYNFQPNGCYEELVQFFKDLAENNGEFETVSNVVFEEEDDFVV